MRAAATNPDRYKRMVLTNPAMPLGNTYTPGVEGHPGLVGRLHDLARTLQPSPPPLAARPIPLSLRRPSSCDSSQA